jgi:oligoribonuclease NrnB/cAMP/cGMP phosphodiesterase (DHH superfamily)
VKPLLCIYHGNCADGFTAALAVKLWADYANVAVDFYAGVYGSPPPDYDGDVLLVDFSYREDDLHKLRETARTVLVLDHHLTAEQALEGVPRVMEPAKWRSYYRGRHSPPNEFACLFDMERSGAQITWDFFHGGFSEKERPWLVDYVGDRDLWRFALPHSREVASWYFSYRYDFEVWDTLRMMLETQFSDVVREGAAILRKHDKDIDELIAATRTDMVIGGHRVPVCNLPYTYASDAAGKMASEAGVPFAACYFDRPDGRVFSLRSRGDFDVAEIAKGYGGGGHRNAAGFQRPHGWRGE